MAIVPKKKISQYKKHRRHSTRQTLELKRISAKYAVGKCSNCGATKLPHKVCLSCGFYNGKQVLTIKMKKSTVVDA